MDTLQLTNYRKFKDTGVIHLKPITFLVGANSSGKSSFLKFFPLLKQSLGVNRNGTFLWYSSDVDFKDFLNTVHNGKGNIDISFTFSSQNLRFQRFRRRANVKGLSEEDIAKTVEISVKLEISGKKTNGKENEDYFSLVVIKYLDQVVQILISEDENTQIIINGHGIEAKFHPALSNNAINLIPRIYEDREDSLYMGVIRKSLDFFRKNIKTAENEESYPLMELEDAFYLIDKKVSSRYLKSLNIEGEDEVLNEMYILMHLNEIIENINYYLFDISTCITYVRPLRVSTERYYRYQNYAVDEIESDGKNLAMYLANLSEKDRMLFQDWTSSLFEFSIDVIKHEGHIELQIKDGVNSPRNLVDTGFGYTQLLPILTMIWNAIMAPSRRSIFYRGDGDIPKFIVIEQPELHLHPRMQAKFGAMLAKVIASEAGKNMRFIIETHSEAILNSVGIEIEQNNLDKDKANIVLFNAAEEGYENYIEEAQYNERGFVEHWPTGFLSEDVY